MIDWYRRMWFVESWALGLCTAPCGTTTAGDPDFVRAQAARHARRHRPGGMVLTDYGARMEGLE